jgi:hypothetical protein
MATKPRGLRCAACTHLIATTRSWLIVSRQRSGARMYCHECADDIESFIRTLEREQATARMPSPLKRRRLALAPYSASGVQ